MVQVALGPDASGESVRPTVLHLTLKIYQNKSLFFNLGCKLQWKVSFLILVLILKNYAPVMLCPSS